MEIQESDSQTEEKEADSDSSISDSDSDNLLEAAIEVEEGEEDLLINDIESWNVDNKVTHVKRAELMMDRPEMGKAHLSGKQCFTHILIEEKLCSCLIDTGASCSIVGKRFLDTMGIKY